MLRADEPAHLVTNSIDRDSVLTVSLTGTWAGQPVTGAASWRRAASGEVEQVTVAVVAARALVKGEPALPKSGRRRSRTSRSRSPPPVNAGWSRAG